MKKINLILLGAPGSGKGTQSEILIREFGMKHISMGDLLREEVKKNSDLGNKIKNILDAGKLVPDDIVVKIIDQRLSEANLEQGLILDGFPRTIRQAEVVDEVLRRRNSKVDKAVYFDVSEETVTKRLSGRRICGKCGAIYHIKNIPPKVEGICDKCYEKLEIRSDDTEEVVKKRYKIYLENTKPLMDYYEGKGNLLVVDANKNAEITFEEITEKIAAFK